jgi:hypothetical protein
MRQGELLSLEHAHIKRNVAVSQLGRAVEATSAIWGLILLPDVKMTTGTPARQLAAFFAGALPLAPEHAGHEF